MKSMILVFLLLSNLAAYEKGDVLSQDMIVYLGLKANKVYIVDFFASWCGSCQKELPLVAKANVILNHNDAEIIGIDVDKNPKNALEFQRVLKSKNNLNFRVINDPKNLVIAAFNPVGMPTLYYIKNNKVMKVLTGAVDHIDEQIYNDLKTMK